MLKGGVFFLGLYMYRFCCKDGGGVVVQGLGGDGACVRRDVSVLVHCSM